MPLLACISSTLKRSHTQATLHWLSLSSPHLTTWYETVKQFIHSFTNPSTHHHSRQHWSAGKKQHWLFHLAPTQWNWNLYVIILRKLFTFHSNSGGGSSSMCLGRWMDGGERFCLHRKAKRNKKKKQLSQWQQLQARDKLKIKDAKTTPNMFFFWGCFFVSQFVCFVSLWSLYAIKLFLHHSNTIYFLN